MPGSKAENQYVINEYGYMRLKEFQALVPFSVSTIWRKLKNGEDIPKPVKLSQKITAWRRADVYAWLGQRGAK